MATSQSPSPFPAGRPDQDDRPSIKVVIAASMLRFGHQPLDIANATGVPLALVELIATEHHPGLPRHPEPIRPSGATGSLLNGSPRASDDDPTTPDLLGQHPQTDGSQRVTRICCAAALVVVGNVGLAAAVEITHSFTVAATAAIVTVLLLTALALCAIGCAYPVRGRLPRPL